MKKITFFFAAAFVIALTSAFVTKQQAMATDDPTTMGWAEPWWSPQECVNASLDYSQYYTCSTIWDGPVCTINSANAYADDFGCEYGFDFDLLRRQE